MNGRLMRGASGSAGELGHICVSDNPYARGYTDRLACTCGHIGCMEMFVTLPMIRWAVVQKMEEVESIAALGAGAISKAVFPDENRIERAENNKDLKSYLENIDEMCRRKERLFGT